MQTKVIKDNSNPEFNESGLLHVELKQDEFKDVMLLINVYDYDFYSNDFIGYVEANLDEVIKLPGEKWINEIY